MTATRKNYVFSAAIIMMLFCTISFSCTDDQKITQTPVSDKYISMAKEILQDSIVLNAKAMQGTVNKTLLPDGCPLKYYFSWRENTDTINIQLKKFTVGKMPLTIWFSINAKFMQLNTWEKEEYPEEGWIKFQGRNGFTDYVDNTEGDYENGTGGNGNLTGYLNVLTNQIEFSTDFNVMLMQSFVFLQTIDKERMDKYNEEFAEYQEELAKYKEEHGM